jgi:hypothetical protein
MTWQDHVDWNRELVLFVFFLNFSEVIEFQVPLFVLFLNIFEVVEFQIPLFEFQIPLFVLFLNISEVVEFQIPLLDVVVTWKKTGSVEAENRAGRE